MTAEHATPSSTEPPKVVWWFKIYSGFMCLLYVFVAAFSLLLFVADPEDFDMSPAEARVIGALLLVLGLVLLAAFLLPLVLRPRPWLWTYNLVLICIGMTSACILPASIPLLIFWIKPEAKRHFGRS